MITKEIYKVFMLCVNDSLLLDSSMLQEKVLSFHIHLLLTCKVVV